MWLKPTFLFNFEQNLKKTSNNFPFTTFGRKTKIKCFDIQRGALWLSAGPLISAQVPALLSREMNFFIPPLYAGAILNSFVYGRGLLHMWVRNNADYFVLGTVAIFTLPYSILYC